MEKKVFLLADDDADDRELFCEAIAAIDDTIICHTVVNGREALNKLDELQQNPDLIFLDVNMPLMNGWQCVKHIKEQEKYKHIPIIVISTSSHQSGMDAAMELGALCYLTKPINFDDLISVLKEIVQNIGENMSRALEELHAGGSRFIYRCFDKAAE